ncbi:hypothetical protein [Gordonia sp. (in: high G+C Gram-positive bacteria)]|uniref:hypothetical protein n=1 Tax=Gordonia sp. (in: high G+C Gram-positive bacteria) TaxID=84139 RepID=UPI00257CE951|nr:hypothetical protein [Gordonia sp. (in: high G+C Gram-positive bacteria)]
MIVNIKRIIAGALIGGAAVMGISFGAGHAEAKIEPGQYKYQAFTWGLIPTPVSNVRIVGDQFYSDISGVGPSDINRATLVPTKNGGILTLSKDPVAMWFGRIEFTKTAYGYHGTTFNYGGIPTGDVVLKKVR